MRKQSIQNGNGLKDSRRKSKSVIKGHAIDRNTDKLYQPLRNAILHNKTFIYPDLMESGVNHSIISHSKLRYGYQQLQQIGKKTYIYEDRKLAPTHNLQLLPKNRQYQIIDVEQKQQQPISFEQVKIRTARKTQNEKIIYVYDDTDPKYKNTVASSNFGKKQRPKTQLKRPPTGSVNLLQNRPKSKFNLFSAIDYPINACVGNLDNNDKKYELLSNQCIAKRHDRAYDINWSTQLKRAKIKF